MTAIKQALAAFWASFAMDGAAIPAYGEDTPATERAPLPYITFRLDCPDALHTADTAATCWLDARDPAANRKRALLCDQIAARIPPQGVRLPVGTGCVVLARSAAGFITDCAAEHPDAAIGARVGLTLTNYTHQEEPI